ncbi:CRISPR-associated helicase Cas3' [Nocardia brasiliensis]|uniref:CRISPR-associated helicase Cas3' n=1 Tax=Nocardia brasiliensis TaxID=37326 RepID=UPI002B4AC9FF|nr:CRISPR-associated helicase Cas3' [Nocardia brasiliensis]
MLSEAARSVWAKSPNTVGEWLPLWQHMDDSADVAGHLFDRWLAPSVVELLVEELGGGREAAGCAVRFLAGVHDLGKATPAFAIQHEGLAQRMREQGLYMRLNRRGMADRQLAHHTVAGHHLLIDWLVERGWSRRWAVAWGVVLGGHHGAPPNQDDRLLRQSYPDLFGEGAWVQVQRELLCRMAERSGVLNYLDGWRELRVSARFQVLVTGIVIVSDWIASNEELLPFLAGDLPEVVVDPQRSRRAVSALALPVPWIPAAIPDVVADIFATRFALPAGAQVRPVQVAACDVAKSMAEPGLLIIEAPMGEGKTEAALAAAEIMAQRWGAGGLLVALPTQATSDAMFARVVDWLDRLGADGQQVGGSITLGHGKARLNRLFQGLVRDRRFGHTEIDCDCGIGSKSVARHAVTAHAWLSGRKKAQLANFSVGTIDQLLFAGLKSRHLMLRHLGLAGKVVVLDEVHAYDAYMNSYLTKVMTWLGNYRVPVIALSATLPADRRQELMAAYQRGSCRTSVPSASEIEGYPILSWTAGEAVQHRRIKPSGRSTPVQVRSLDGKVDDDAGELIALLEDKLSEGGCALVIRNTVRRVLATATALERCFPGEVTVVHARFIAADRMRKDIELLDRFGSPDRAQRRPGRHIVVASQVVEQSLDIDFDLLVTDLAPIDLVLQRMGRLHRHQRGESQSDRPPKLRVAQTYIAGVEFTAGVPELEPAAARHVYGEYPLLRAAAVLLPHLGQAIGLPDDIAPLVQRAYGHQQAGPESWQDAMNAARRSWLDRCAVRAANAEKFQLKEPARPGNSIVGWVAADVGETDDDSQGQGQVRDGAPSLEAVVVQQHPDGQWFTPSWLTEDQGNRPIPREATPPDQLAQIMATCSLRLPLEFSTERAEGELWAATPEEWEFSPLIFRLPVLVIDQDGFAEIAGRGVHYTLAAGLQIMAAEEAARHPDDAPREASIHS